MPNVDLRRKQFTWVIMFGLDRYAVDCPVLIILNKCIALHHVIKIWLPFVTHETHKGQTFSLKGQKDPFHPMKINRTEHPSPCRQL